MLSQLYQKLWKSPCEKRGTIRTAVWYLRLFSAVAMATKLPILALLLFLSNYLLGKLDQPKNLGRKLNYRRYR